MHDARSARRWCKSEGSVRANSITFQETDARTRGHGSQVVVGQGQIHSQAREPTDLSRSDAARRLHLDPSGRAYHSLCQLVCAPGCDRRARRNVETAASAEDAAAAATLRRAVDLLVAAHCAEGKAVEGGERLEELVEDRDEDVPGVLTIVVTGSGVVMLIRPSR